MGKVKKKLIDEAAGRKAAAEARRQRDLKKFGKAVQVARLQERDKAKRDTLDRISALKRSMSLYVKSASKLIFYSSFVKAYHAQKQIDAN